MTITSGFFKSVNGDRKYKAEFFASYFASFIGNGVFPNPSSNLQVLAFQNMQTRVSAGKAWINGYYLLNDEPITIVHAPADGVLPRIDRIVFGLNFDSRQMNIYLKQGTPGTNATAPQLIRNATLFEMALADVAIIPGTTSISQSNITDQRLNKDLCGIVQGTVEQVDTTTIFNQYQQALLEFETVQEADFLQWSAARRIEFEAWYADLQDTLDGNVAANLLLRIQKIENIRELSKFNLFDGTKNFSGTWENNSFWGIANAENSFKNFVTRSRATSYSGLSKPFVIPVGTYTLSAYIRTTGDRRYQGYLLGLGSTAVISGASSAVYQPHSDWRLVSFTFTVSQSGTIRPRFEPIDTGVGTVYIAGYNLYAGDYKRDWFPSENDILIQNVPVKATTEQAISATDDNAFMTPQKTKQLGDNFYLSKTGGSLTGDVAINKNVASLSLASANGSNLIRFRNNANDTNDFGFDVYRKNQNVMTINANGIMSVLDTDGTLFSLPSLKQSVSNGKALVASAVTGKGVQTAADATFSTIASNINAIPTGPLQSSGTVLCSTDTLNFPTSTGSSINFRYITVSSLNFMPSRIVIKYLNGTSRVTTTYDFISEGSYCSVSSFTSNTTASRNFFVNLGGTSYISANGFRLPVDIDSQQTFTWFAQQ